MVKQSWQDRTKEISEFHKKKLKEMEDWTIQNTADELHWGYGTVAEMLQVADFSRTYPKILDYKTFNEATAFVRAKRKELRMR
jgi:hypothetical protein